MSILFITNLKWNVIVRHFECPLCSKSKPRIVIMRHVMYSKFLREVLRLNFYVERMLSTTLKRLKTKRKRGQEWSNLKSPPSFLNPGLLLFIFVVDYSDRQSRRRAHWPLDQQNGQVARFLTYQPGEFRLLRCSPSWPWWRWRWSVQRRGSYLGPAKWRWPRRPRTTRCRPCWSWRRWGGRIWKF